jgi:hypothetical protein
MCNNCFKNFTCPEDEKADVFWTSALDEGNGHLQPPTALPPRERVPRTHWIGGWGFMRSAGQDLPYDLTQEVEG